MAFKPALMLMTALSFALGFAATVDAFGIAGACEDDLNQAWVTYNNEGAQAEGCCDETMVSSFVATVPSDWIEGPEDEEGSNVGSFHFAFAKVSSSAAPLGSTVTCTDAACDETIAAMSGVDGDNDEEWWFGNWMGSSHSCDGR